MSPFYECRFAGQILDPPLAWKVIQSISAESSWRSPKGKSLSLEIVQGLYEMAIVTPGPWLVQGSDYLPLLGVTRAVHRTLSSDLTGRRKLLYSTAVLLALPLLEMEARTARRGKVKDSRGRRRMLLVRLVSPADARARVSKTRKSNASGDLGLLPDAQRITDAWLGEQISFAHPNEHRTLPGES